MSVTRQIAMTLRRKIMPAGTVEISVSRDAVMAWEPVVVTATLSGFRGAQKVALHFGNTDAMPNIIPMIPTTDGSYIAVIEGVPAGAMSCRAVVCAGAKTVESEVASWAVLHGDTGNTARFTDVSSSVAGGFGLWRQAAIDFNNPCTAENECTCEVTGENGLPTTWRINHGRVVTGSSALTLFNTAQLAEFGAKAPVLQIYNYIGSEFVSPRLLHGAGTLYFTSKAYAGRPATLRVDVSTVAEPTEGDWLSKGHFTYTSANPAQAVALAINDRNVKRVRIYRETEEVIAGTANKYSTGAVVVDDIMLSIPSASVVVRDVSPIDALLPLDAAGNTARQTDVTASSAGGFGLWRQASSSFNPGTAADAASCAVTGEDNSPTEWTIIHGRVAAGLPTFTLFNSTELAAFGATSPVLQMYNCVGSAIVSPRLTHGVGTLSFTGRIYGSGYSATLRVDVSHEAEPAEADWVVAGMIDYTPTDPAQAVALAINDRNVKRVRIYRETEQAVSSGNQFTTGAVVMDNIGITAPATPTLLRCRVANTSDRFPCINRKVTLWHTTGDATNPPKPDTLPDGDSGELDGWAWQAMTLVDGSDVLTGTWEATPAPAADIAAYFFRCDFDGYHYERSPDGGITPAISTKVSPVFST